MNVQHNALLLLLIFLKNIKRVAEARFWKAA